MTYGLHMFRDDPLDITVDSGSGTGAPRVPGASSV